MTTRWLSTRSTPIIRKYGSTKEINLREGVVGPEGRGQRRCPRVPDVGVPWEVTEILPLASII